MTSDLCRNPRCGKARARQPDGRLEGSLGLCKPCYTRWDRAGRPDEVPEPMSHAERTALSNRVKLGLVPPPELEPDGYDERWAAGEPSRRLRRAHPQAVALARCQAAGDQKGVFELRHRIRDWEAVATVLAERATLAAAARARPSAGADTRQAVTRALRAAQEVSDAA